MHFQLKSVFSILFTFVASSTLAVLLTEPTVYAQTRDVRELTQPPFQAHHIQVQLGQFSPGMTWEFDGEVDFAVGYRLKSYQPVKRSTRTDDLDQSETYLIPEGKAVELKKGFQISGQSIAALFKELELYNDLQLELSLVDSGWFGGTMKSKSIRLADIPYTRPVTLTVVDEWAPDRRDPTYTQVTMTLQYVLPAGTTLDGVLRPNSARARIEAWWASPELQWGVWSARKQLAEKLLHEEGIDLDQELATEKDKKLGRLLDDFKASIETSVKNTQGAHELGVAAALLQKGYALAKVMQFFSALREEEMSELSLASTVVKSVKLIAMKELFEHRAAGAAKDAKNQAEAIAKRVLK